MRVYILSYFLLINIISFIVRGIDKWKAQHNKRRIKEKTLLGFAAAGGWVGALIAMGQLRHKTVKGKFLVWFWLRVALWIIGSITLLIFLS